MKFFGLPLLPSLSFFLYFFFLELDALILIESPVFQPWPKPITPSNPTLPLCSAFTKVGSTIWFPKLIFSASSYIADIFLPLMMGCLCLTGNFYGLWRIANTQRLQITADRWFMYQLSACLFAFRYMCINKYIWIQYCKVKYVISPWDAGLHILSQLQYQHI